ncbi:MAG: ATP synthase F1 subunit delta [Acidimicrobiia bacterium]|nr:ATP synthase F1 subunit delta [Acidimicrobiia bacterium]
MDLATDQASRIEGYSAALLAIARAEREADLLVELPAAATALASHSELIETLRDPRVPAERKQAIVDELLSHRASLVTVAAINFLVSSGQAKHLGQIATRLTELAAESQGEVVAEVRAPMELAPEQVERLREKLEQVTNRRVQVRVIVDPSVVGGVVTKIGDTVLDGSIHSRFVELREQWG